MYMRNAWFCHGGRSHRGKNKATKMSILDLGPYMFGDVDQQIDWFQSKGLLATSKTCPASNQPMNIQTHSDVTDMSRYVCNVHNSLWHAFITVGDVVTLPAGRQQALGMGPSLQSPI